MPIDTPKRALTLDELPLTSNQDQALQVIVNTSLGVKKMPIGEIFKPYTLLIGTYQYYARGFPCDFSIPLLGGILDPQDFVDSLAILKERIPQEWILTDGKVQLPLVMDEVLQMDLSLTPGKFQSDAMQKITGYFYVHDNSASAGGAFSGHYAGNGNLHGGHAGGVRCYYLLDSSRETRTADRTRERTLNAILCMFVGQVKPTRTKRYWVIDHLHGEALGWYIDLCIGHDGKGIGSNPVVLTDEEPKELSQEKVALLFKDALASDPMGVALQVQGRGVFDLSLLRLDYRSFRIGGKDIVFTGSFDGIRISGGASYMTFKGTPLYTSNTLWGSRFGMEYTCYSVTVGGQGFTSFSLTGISAVSLRLRVKEDLVVVSITSGGKPLEDAWWKALKELWPADKPVDFDQWSASMPAGVFNAANKEDTYDTYPLSRFYMRCDGYEKKSSSQKEIWEKFHGTDTEDYLGIYEALNKNAFNLDSFCSQHERTFFLDGKQVTFSANGKGFSWKSSSGHSFYCRCLASLERQRGQKFSDQGTHIRYETVQGQWFVHNGIREFALTTSLHFTVMIFAKSSSILVCFAGQTFSYLDKDSLSQFSYERDSEDDIRDIFRYFPVQWGNTLNEDTYGTVMGTKESRFWMHGVV